MLFRKYKIVVLKHDGAMFFRFPMRGIMVVAATLLFIALAISGGYFYTFYDDYRAMDQRVTALEKRIVNQKVQLLGDFFEFDRVEKNYEGITDFNSKLRVMLHLKKNEPEIMSDLGYGGFAEDMYIKSFSGLFYRNMARQMHRQHMYLYANIRREEVYQQKIMKAIVEQKEQLTRIPSIWPVRGRFSSPYGYRRSPFTGRREFHKGIDVTAPKGSPIFTSAAGKISFARRFSSYGLMVDVNHGSGIRTRYAHMTRIAVKVGQEVERGECIGYVGNTGRSTAPHLHYEVHVQGETVNPLHYILN